MSFRYGHEDLDLFVESGTDRVPDDGAFYLVSRGVVGERFSNSKQALARLNQVRFNSGLLDASQAGGTAMQRALGAEMAARHAAEFSPLKADRQRKGGKGR